VEGLLIHAVVRGLAARLPLRSLGWSFPDEGTAALLLEGLGNLVLRYRPPSPILTLEEGRVEGEAKTPFQCLLEARCKGRLLRLEQIKLDRVVFLEFAGEKGFVDMAPARLIFELTGRNANLMVCDLSGQIMGIDRPVTSAVNRFRELRPGLPYTPPPPYQKLDPRSLRVDELQPFLGKTLAQLIKNLDGVGKELSAELLRRADLSPDSPLTPEHLRLVHRVIHRLVEQPAQRTDLSAELRAAWEQSRQIAAAGGEDPKAQLQAQTALSLGPELERPGPAPVGGSGAQGYGLVVAPEPQKVVVVAAKHVGRLSHGIDNPAVI
jgi:predicted ribosome quality control (RQC) complex YloA/Tae2 family protein